MFRSFSTISLRGLVSVFVVLICLTGTKAQEIEYVGSYYLGGEFKAIHVDEPYAICGMKNGFQILDVSNPEAISQVGGNPFVGHVKGFGVSGTYAYVTTYADDFADFLIIDIQDVENPVITAVLDSARVGKLAVSASYAYIYYQDVIEIVDVSDPFNPAVVGEYICANSVRDMFISGTYAYLAVEGGWLEILEISNPVEPVLITQYFSPLSDNFREVFISGGYAYCVVLSSSGGGFIMEIVDVSDPFTPAYVGHLDTWWRVQDIFVDGDYLYAFREDMFDGAVFIIVNVEDPENPYIEWSDLFGFILDPLYVFVSHDRAYLTWNYSLTIMDVSDPSAPIELGDYRSKSGLDRIAASDNYVYGIFKSQGGLYVFNVSDPSNPELVAADNYLAGGSYDMALLGNYIYVAGHSLEIIDISVPEYPAFVGEYGESYAKGIDVHGQYAYLAVANAELQVVDITDPGNPALVGQCPLEAPRDIFVRDDLAFIARYRDDLGLAVVDISDPGEPVFLGGCEAPDRVHKWVDVQGQYAYMTVGYYGIQIIDISDPYNPHPVAYYDTPSRADDVFIEENYAYIADVQNGLTIIDISDPPNPALVASHDTPGWASGCHVAGQYIYVADFYSLMILRFIHGPCVYTPGDVNHNGIPLELNDVLTMIGNYRGTVAPYYRCDCGVDPPGSRFAATADPNGNCIPFELGDVVTEIGAYRGMAEASGCPDCPGSDR